MKVVNASVRPAEDRPPSLIDVIGAPTPEQARHMASAWAIAKASSSSSGAQRTRTREAA